MKLLSYLVLFLIYSITYSQIFPTGDVKLPPGLSLSNQLEYSYDTKLDQEIFENWLNIDYHYGAFTTGIRFEIFQPNDPNPAVSRGKNRYADIAYKYMKVSLGDIRNKLNITVGNYYESFGRGLVLKSYEDRNIRVDNNLLGVKLEGSYKNIHLKALTGSGANANDQRKDILHAVDLEFRGIKKLKVGLAFASNNPENTNVSATRLVGFRIAPSLDFLDIHSEYALKLNDDIKKNVFSNSRQIAGKAFYTNINFYTGNFALLGELKYYDNFNFTSGDGSIQYNTSPAVIRDYGYILLNRHPHALNQNNEKGFQIEANYVFNEITSIKASYGLTNTNGRNSIYNKVLGIEQNSRDLLTEYYFQVQHEWNNKLKSIFTLGYNEAATDNSINLTPILESTYSLNETNTLRFIIEHQQTKNEITDEKYYSDVITLEYLRSPDLTVSFVGEMKTSELSLNNLKRDYWGFVQAVFPLNDFIDMSLLVGSRQAGNLCIGGVCRYEPEFEGVELKIMTRLY